jgi:2-iminobutanoate/2-iminopropanoate deaminase
MPKQMIETDRAPAAVGGYSQGIRAGDFIYVCGCGPIDPVTGAIIPGTIEEQTALAIDNVEAILEAGGATLADVVKGTVHLADETEFRGFDNVYAARFPKPWPVRTTVGSGMRQVPGMRIEIDVVAYVGP